MRRLIWTAMILGWMAGAARAAEAPVTVFAAASLKDALGAVSAAWAALGHPKFIVSYESSAVLAKQIERGAPAAIFISADEKWMDYLAGKNLIDPASRKDVLSNTLVLVVPADHPQTVKLNFGFDIADVLGATGKLAVGDPKSVPAGIYAQQALTHLANWDYASSHLAPAENVRAALLLVDKGEAAAGVVYGTDAKADPKVMVAGTFPADSHDLIAYPFALVARNGATAEAHAARAFMQSPAAKAIYAQYGFGTE